MILCPWQLLYLLSVISAHIFLKSSDSHNVVCLSCELLFLLPICLTVVDSSNPAYTQSFVCC